MLIIAVALFLVWTLLDRFGDSLEAVTDMANEKVIIERSKQKAKHRKVRGKLQEKSASDDEPILSSKALDKILDGKSTYEAEMAKLLKDIKEK